MHSTTVISETHNTSPSPNSAERLLVRLRHTIAPSLLWAMAGAIPGMIWTLLQSPGLINQIGAPAWIGRAALISFSSAFTMGLVFGISAGTGTDMARRPARFLVALALGATCALAVNWLIDILIPVAVARPLAQRLLDWWLTLILFGAVFGWAGISYIRRMEDKNTLAALLARRSLLSRQVAHYRLNTARAQIDPELVARILRAVRERYRTDEANAAALLDQLIGYLRLAMGRVRGQQTTIAAELSLIRAYRELRETESAQPIGLQLDCDDSASTHQTPVPVPLFLIAREMLEAALGAPAARVALHIQMHATQIALALDTGSSPLSADRQVHLDERLRELAAGPVKLDILQHFLESGVNRYVVRAAIS